MILSIVCFFFSMVFLVLFILTSKNIQNMKKIEAKITGISEHRIEQSDWISPLIYFYPEITYQYNYLGKQYLGEVSKYNADKYKVSEATPLGNRMDDEYFWRHLSVGDPISIYINENKPSQSDLLGYESKSYVSQNRVYLILGIAFFLICSGLYIFSI